MESIPLTDNELHNLHEHYGIIKPVITFKNRNGLKINEVELAELSTEVTPCSCAIPKHCVCVCTLVHAHLISIL